MHEGEENARRGDRYDRAVRTLERKLHVPAKSGLLCDARDRGAHHDRSENRPDGEARDVIRRRNDVQQSSQRGEGRPHRGDTQSASDQRETPYVRSQWESSTAFAADRRQPAWWAVPAGIAPIRPKNERHHRDGPWNSRGDAQIDGCEQPPHERRYAGDDQTGDDRSKPDRESLPHKPSFALYY